MRTVSFSRAEEIELRSILDEHFLIVLHAGESRMFSLNGMGLWFWQRLERPATKDELLTQMVKEYDVSEEIAASEIDRFMAHLLEKKLVKRKEFEN